jgi:hypothetical protein
MSNKSRSHRTPDPHRRRWGVTGTRVGVLVGGAMAAAFVSTGTASADDVLALAANNDPFTELVQAIDPTAVTAAGNPDDIVSGAVAAAAALPAQATLDDFEELVEAIDPNAFTSAGDPNDFIGIIASQIDSDLASTEFGPELDTIAGQILAGDWAATTSTDVDAFAVLVQTFVDPNAFNSAGDPTDFIGTIASQLDTLFDPSVYGPELDTIADQIVSIFTTAAAAAADPAAWIP